MAPTLYYTPPTGWSIVAGPTLVTAENQTSFAAGPLSNCGIRSQAVSLNGSYAPPLGWFVVQLNRPAGDSYTTLVDVETVWVAPDGTASGLAACGPVGQASFIDPPPEAVVKSAIPWSLVIVAAGAFLAYKFWR